MPVWDLFYFFYFFSVQDVTLNFKHWSWFILIFVLYNICQLKLKMRKERQELRKADSHPTPVYSQSQIICIILHLLNYPDCVCIFDGCDLIFLKKIVQFQFLNFFHSAQVFLNFTTCVVCMCVCDFKTANRKEPNLGHNYIPLTDSRNNLHGPWCCYETVGLIWETQKYLHEHGNNSRH